MTIANGVGPAGVAEPRSSGIDVIIVGLGIAGLVAAIECHYKGHRVIGLEKSPEIRVLGMCSRFVFPH
jgi:flavin-dependent dehydrogenase